MPRVPNGDRPAVHAVVQAYPSVCERHRAECVGMADAVPGGDDAYGQILARLGLPAATPAGVRNAGQT
jgi:hypothetical protein